MKRRRLYAAGALLVASMVVVCGCGKEEPAPSGPGPTPTPTPTPTPAKEPIKIGAMFSKTGAAFLGEPEWNTALMIAEEINKGGGIGGKGENRPIELLLMDTETKPDVAVRNAKEFIRKGVVAIIGPSTSGESLQVVPVCMEAKVPLVSCAAAETITTDESGRQREWIFKTPQLDSDCVRRIFDHMKAKGIAKIAIITAATGFGDAGAAQLKKLAPEAGIEIVLAETYPKDAIDMTAQLTRIRGTEAQALVNWSIEAAQSQIAKDMKTLGMTIPLYQSHGFGNIKFAQASGEAGAGIIFPAGRLLIAETLEEDHPQKQVLAAYKRAYEARYGSEVSTFGGHAYDALHIVVKAIEQNGPTAAGIRDALETMDFVGTAGHFKMSQADHCGLGKDAFEMLTVQWQDGKPRFVKLVE